MCWVAFDRGIRMAAAHGRPAAIDRWTAARDAIYRQIMDEGWSTDRQAFVEQYGSDVLDSSLLRMPAVRFISPHDPMWASTLVAMDGELVSDSWCTATTRAPHPTACKVPRARSPSARSCTSTRWRGQAELEDARLAFEKMLTYANHVGCTPRRSP